MARLHRGGYTRAMANSETPPGAELRTVARFKTPEEAEVARLTLENEGIFTAFEGRRTVGMAWHLGAAVGWVKSSAAFAERMATVRPTTSAGFIFFA